MNNWNQKYDHTILQNLSEMFGFLDTKCYVTGCMKKEVIIAGLVDLMDDFYKHMKDVHGSKQLKNQLKIYNSNHEGAEYSQKSIIIPPTNPSLCGGKRDENDSNIPFDTNACKLPDSFVEAKVLKEENLGHMKRKISPIENESDVSGEDMMHVKSPKYGKLDPFRRRDRVASSGSSSEEENKTRSMKAKFCTEGILLPSTSTGYHSHLKRKINIPNEDSNYILNSDNNTKGSKYPKMDQIEGQCGREVNVLSRDLEEMQLKKVKN